MTTFTDLPADIILLIFQIRPFPTNLNKQIYSIYKDSPHFNLFQRIPNFKPITLFHKNLAQYIHMDHPELTHSDLCKVIRKGHLESIKYSIVMIDDIGFQTLFNITYEIDTPYAVGCFTWRKYLMWFLKSIDLLFQFACFSGHLSVAKWRLKYCPEIDISAENEYLFRRACAWGHLSIVIWLLKQKPTINISADNEGAFRCACNYDHISIAKWLLKKKPSIDISANDEEAFEWACMVGRIHMAKWLLEQKPTIDIAVNNEYIFCMACFNGNLPVVKFIIENHSIPNISDYIDPGYPSHILDYLESL